MLEARKISLLNEGIISLFTLLLSFGFTSQLFGACSNPAYNVGAWATYNNGDIVSSGGIDYRANAGAAPDGAYAVAPPSAGWVVDANPCAGPVPILAATTGASSVTETTAESGGNVTSDNGSAITERGIVYGTSSNPTTADSKVTTAGTTGAFGPLSMTGLTGETKYFVRAYAINGNGTGYGTETYFRTGKSPTVVTDDPPWDIYCESVTLGMERTAFGRDYSVSPTDALGTPFSEFTEVGYIYGTSNADVTSSTVSSLDGASVKEVSFTYKLSPAVNGRVIPEPAHEITGLTPSTTYYYKAYGTNSQGTSYGSVVSFTTTAACKVFYSCAYDAAVANRWSYNSDCSTNDGADVDGTSICYHRHDWGVTAMTDMDAHLDAEVAGQPMTVGPYRLVVQSGSRVYTNHSLFPSGAQLIVQSNGRYGHVGTLNFESDKVAGTGNMFSRVENTDGSILVKGSYSNKLDISGTGEFCYRGSWTNAKTDNMGQGGINGDYDPTPTFGATRYTNGSCLGTAVLPVELLSFEVQYKNLGHVDLTWVTGSELNNDYFEVWASEDGVRWDVIEVIDGAGTTDRVSYYTTIDGDVNGLTQKYYALRQVDFDGSTNTSKVKYVSFEGKGGIINVVEVGNLIQVIIDGEYEFIDPKFYTMDGKEIQSTFSVRGGNKLTVLDIVKPNDSVGLHLLTVKAGSNRFTRKVVLSR